MAAQKAAYTSSTSPSLTPSTLSPVNATANSSLVPPPWSLNRDPFWKSVHMSLQVTGTLEAILIIASNILLLVVILSSPLLRSRMRNKLVINVVISNLLVGILGAPFTVDYTMKGRWVHSCFVTVILAVLLAFVQNFINMWGVVGLLLHYVARLLRYEGPPWVGRLPLVLQRALPALLTCSPWIVSVVLLIPMIFGGLNRSVLTVWSYNTCPFILEKWARYLLNTFSFFIPALVLVALIVVVILLRRRRDEKPASDSPGRMERGQAVMTDPGQEVEACWVHVLVGVLTVLMMGPEHIFLVFKRGPWQHIIIASITVHLLSDLLPFVVALVWLILLPDVRGRLKQLLTKLHTYLVCFWTNSPPQAPGSTSISPVAFKDLQDE
ncbi:hypothetical protein ACOMHN_065320 [Nucella lapillus]